MSFNTFFPVALKYAYSKSFHTFNAFSKTLRRHYPVLCVPALTARAQPYKLNPRCVYKAKQLLRNTLACEGVAQRRLWDGAKSQLISKARSGSIFKGWVISVMQPFVICLNIDRHFNLMYDRLNIYILRSNCCTLNHRHVQNQKSRKI